MHLKNGQAESYLRNAEQLRHDKKLRPPPTPRPPLMLLGQTFTAAAAAVAVARRGGWTDGAIIRIILDHSARAWRSMWRESDRPRSSAVMWAHFMDSLAPPTHALTSYSAQ